MAAALKDIGPRAADSRALGRYRLLLTLGQGGMGTIHLALAEGTGGFQKLVVIKELREERSGDKNFVEMFLAEARLAGQLNHPNIVQTLEAAQVNGRLFLAMEFLDGQPLSELMKSGKLPLRLLLQVLCDTLAGLHYAHELRDYGGNALGIVHCDVSPHNVFVTYDGHVKVVDFGIARAAGKDTQGGFLGRLEYASPEQIVHAPVDRRADIFAVGVILWEALARRRFITPGTNDAEIVSARINGTEPKISEVSPGIHARLSQICETALSTDPSRRFSTAEEFRLALAQHLDSLGKPLDPSEIGALVALTFHQARARLNGLIHEQMQDGERLDLSAPNVGPESDEFEVTRVADLRQFVEMTRSGEVDPRLVLAYRNPQKKRSLSWIFGLVALVLVALAWWSQSSTPAPRAALPSATPHWKAAATAAEGVPVPVPVPAIAAPENLEATPDGAASAEPRPRAVGRAHPAPARAPKRGESLERSLPVAPADPAPTPRPSASSAPAVKMGADLTEVRARVRTIDEESPFRSSR